MNNWIKVSPEEVKIGMSIANLKKGDLQIKYVKDITKQQQETKRYKNIIDELETFLEEQFKDTYAVSNGIVYEEIKDKLKELKGSDE